MIEIDEDAAPPAWYRASVEREFKVGDRVVVRVSAESQVTPQTAERVYGRAGVVTAVASARHAPFRYGVRGDIFDGWFAAIELEPIDAGEGGPRCD